MRFPIVRLPRSCSSTELPTHGRTSPALNVMRQCQHLYSKRPDNLFVVILLVAREESNPLLATYGSAAQPRKLKSASVPPPPPPIIAPALPSSPPRSENPLDPPAPFPQKCGIIEKQTIARTLQLAPPHKTTPRLRQVPQEPDGKGTDPHFPTTRLPEPSIGTRDRQLPLISGWAATKGTTLYVPKGG